VEPEAPDPLIGTKLAGRYAIRRLVGVGAMGVVYEADQSPIGRKVAVKVLMRGSEDDPAIVKRFFREAKTASLLSNPHTVTIHDFGRAQDGTLFLVMEYLEGESLASRIERQGSIDPEEAAEITAQVMRALVEAHKKGVIHRDLKPDNVHLVAGDDGRLLVKVLDFGIARMHEREGKLEPGLTSAGTIIGTPRYMAPEQARGDSPGPGADLYSVGCMLFEMLSGVVPFEDDDPILLLGKHIRDPVPAIESMGVRRVPPPALSGLVRHLLEKDAARRPPDASAVLKTLRQFLGASQSGPIFFDASKAVPKTQSGPQAVVVAHVPTPPAGELAFEATIVAGAPTTRESPAVEPPGPPQMPDTGSTSVLQAQRKRLPIPAIAGAAALVVIVFAAIAIRVAGGGESAAVPRPAVPIPAFVDLRLAITPASAEVVRDGRVVGQGPVFALSVPASPGVIAFEVRRAGYQSEHVSWTSSSSLSRAVTLLPEGASLPDTSGPAVGTAATATAAPATAAPATARTTPRTSHPSKRPHPETGSPFSKVR